MNKLTGKALEDFTKWNGDIQFDMMLPFEYTICLNALIIEWLECCDKLKNFNSFDNIFYREYRLTGFKNRQEATEKAIEQANLIYNERV